jgi:uncharacterized protein (TIGR03435 family)
MMLRICVVALLAGSMGMPVARGQDKPERLTFEVATIKPSDENSLNGGIKPLPGGNGYVTQNVPIKLMISLMFEIPMRQITGAPGWTESDRYDIEAKADHGGYSKDDLHEMFRNLLQERFSLKFHQETKEGKVYALTVDRAGVKMAVNTSAQDYNIPITYSGFSVVGKRVPMKYLCWWLGQQLEREERPVIDKTGLPGNYDFTLQFVPDRLTDTAKDSLPAELQDSPTIFDALREQLGLKLSPEQGPVEYFTIDHVEKPSAN